MRVGGGRIHGSRPRDHSYRVPAQVRRLALQSARAARAAAEGLLVVDDFQIETPKTKTVAGMLRNMGLEGRKVLLVSRASDANLMLSCRNLPKTQVSHAGELNAYVVLQSEAVVMTRCGLEALTEVLVG